MTDKSESDGPHPGFETVEFKSICPGVYHIMDLCRLAKQLEKAQCEYNRILKEAGEKDDTIE